MTLDKLWRLVQARVARGSVFCPVTLMDVAEMLRSSYRNVSQETYWRETERFVGEHVADVDGVLGRAHIDLKCPSG